MRSHCTSRGLRRSRPPCRRLALNAPDLRPWPRSPVGWLPAAQRHRAATAGSASGRQRRKARQKGAAPACPQSQSARGGWAARCSFAAVPPGARGPRQYRHVRVLRTTGHAMARRENDHDRPPRRRFPHPPQCPKEPGPGLRVQGAQAGWQGQRRQVRDASPRIGWRHRKAHRPASRLAPGAWPYRGALRRGEADPNVATRDHQDTAGQSATGQPAVACQAPALHRARRRGPRWRAGPGLRAAGR